MEMPCSLAARHSLVVLCRLWHDVDEAIKPQQTAGIVKSIRRNASGAAVTAREPSVSSAPSSPTRVHEVTEQALEEEPARLAAELDARFKKSESQADARFQQLQAQLNRLEEQLSRLSATASLSRLSFV